MLHLLNCVAGRPPHIRAARVTQNQGRTGKVSGNRTAAQIVLVLAPATPLGSDSSRALKCDSCPTSINVLEQLSVVADRVPGPCSGSPGALSATITRVRAAPGRCRRFACNACHRTGKHPPRPGRVVRRGPGVTGAGHGVIWSSPLPEAG